jgi:hypothetical protein
MSRKRSGCENGKRVRVEKREPRAPVAFFLRSPDRSADILVRRVGQCGTREADKNVRAPLREIIYEAASL